jgi:STE24 endopeptidase
MLTLIILILLAGYIFEFVLDFLNIKNWSDKVPAIVKDVYPEEKYIKAKEYSLVNYRFSQITKLLSFLILIALLLYGGFGWLDQYARTLTNSHVVIAMIFFGVLGFASDLISLPFDLYKTFVIEEKFGFNKTTMKTFIMDKVKAYLLTIIFGGLILAALVKTFQLTGNNFWWLAWIFFTLLMLVMTVFYASWILPLFNKLTPLPDGDLRKAIEEYSVKNNFPLKDIFVMDGSKRSAKANAFFSGMGKKKKIVLFDTLISQHTTEELVAVLAHETGHFKLKPTRVGVIAGILQTAIMLYLFSLLQGNHLLFEALGAREGGLHLELFAFALLYSPVSVVTGILMHLLSRRNEFEADAFAKKTYDGNTLSSALKKLSADNLSNLTPHPAYVFVHYSHPPLLKRLEALGMER